MRDAHRGAGPSQEKSQFGQRFLSKFSARQAKPLREKQVNEAQVELPSNRKFGILFSLIFLILTGYFYSQSGWALFFFGGCALVFLAATALKPEALRPLNQLWMKLAFWLSKVMSPVVFGAIFFGLVAPYGVAMRLFGRDALRLKKNSSESFWVARPQTNPQTNFSDQF